MDSRGKSPDHWKVARPRNGHWAPFLGGVLFSALLLLQGLAVQAAESPISADVQPLTLRARTAAPCLIDVRLKSRQRAMIEGTLQLRVESMGVLLFEQETQDVILSSGATNLRLLVPVSVVTRGSTIDAHLRFTTAKDSYDLGRFPISNESTTLRQYVIGVCSMATASSASRSQLWQAIRPDALFSAENSSFRHLQSAPVFFSPEDLPSELGLCAVDTVVVEGASFAALQSKQLAALSTWVKAGGSLFVVPRAPLDAEHATFLNELTTSRGKTPAIVSEPGGAFTISTGPTLLKRAGLGRVVITQEPPASETAMTTPEWRRATLFLAKARKEVVDGQRIDPTLFEEDFRRQGYTPTRASLSQSAIAGLLPKSPRMIPLPIIVLILGAFVFCVGPGEWWFLGRLRARRWTWLTFPFLSVGFTLLTVRTAEHFLGRHDRRAMLVVSDLGEDGRLLRENRIELLFTGGNKTVATDFRQSLTANCTAERSYGVVDEVNQRKTTRYQGVVPSHYSRQMSLRQWTPYLTREMRFSPEKPAADFSGLPWDLVDARQLASYDRKQIVTRFNELGWSIKVYHRSQTVDSDSRDRMADSLTCFERPDNEMWAASLSPSGRGDLLDLPMHDPTDPNEWLFVAVKSEGSIRHMVRRLYRTDE